MKIFTFLIIVVEMAWMAFPNHARGGELLVLSVSPAAHTVGVPVDSAIVIKFSAPVLLSSVQLGQSLNVFGKWSGSVTGTISFSDDDKTITLNPSKPFSHGESVMVSLSHGISTPKLLTLRPGGYSFQFWTNARLSPRLFTLNEVLTTRTIPTESSRAYGGIASDVNGDGFLDVTIVNEDTADLRVFLNKADRTGDYFPFTQPTFPVNNRASPSEPTDFNRDGIVDICVANINTATVSILLGVGDGTFAAQQEVTVGSFPRGIAVLDVDGDGDMDIVNTNFGANNLSLLLNNGSGVFGPATFFEGGGSGEWALAAADMTNDGILDLVVGLRAATLISVLQGNGDATFTLVETQSADGAVWMLVCGDLNGDGNEDVSAANSGQNRSAILLGEGAGQLSAPVRYSGEAFPIATDFGDLDGDNDLDWITASYSGDWSVYINDGLGAFTRVQQIPSTLAASCALLLDFDNDGDLDLSLVDEEADELRMMKNSGTAPFVGDSDNDCHVALTDHAAFSTCMAGPASCVSTACLPLDYDDDCDVDELDFRAFAAAFTGNGSFLPGCTP
ncbi:MAG: FG-GAP-like repeat-containing protein [Planctomycetota bacterium]